jgi:hypothetical protein
VDARLLTSGHIFRLRLNAMPFVYVFTLVRAGDVAEHTVGRYTSCTAPPLRKRWEQRQHYQRQRQREWLTRYGASPARVYFIGGSNGGREALKVVDRWPIDYDGVMAAYASWNQIETDLQFIHITQVMYAKGGAGQAGWLPPAKTKLLRSAVMSVCDAQDGVKDDIISNPSGCHFDPASLRCKDGKDRKGCLSDGQERTVAAFSAPQITTFSVENGMHQEAGYNVLRGADLVGNMGWFRHPFRPAIPYFNSVYYVIGDGVVRSFLTHGPQVSLFDIDTRNGSALGHDPKQYLPRAREQSVEDDASLADLSPFQRHGGKMSRLPAWS